MEEATPEVVQQPEMKAPLNINSSNFVITKDTK